MYITSLVILTAAAIAVSVTMGCVSAAQQKEMAKQNAEMQEQQAMMAQQLAEREAIAHEQDTREQVRLEREQNDKIKAKIRNEGGVSGLVQTTGTPLLMQIKNAENMEFNAQQQWRSGMIEADNIRMNGALNAYGHNAAAASTRAQGKAAATQSVGQGIAGGLRSASSGVSSGVSYMNAGSKLV